MKTTIKIFAIIALLFSGFTIQAQTVTRVKRLKITKIEEAIPTDTILAFNAQKRVVKTGIAVSDLGGSDLENYYEEPKTADGDYKVVIGDTLNSYGYQFDGIHIDKKGTNYTGYDYSYYSFGKNGVGSLVISEDPSGYNKPNLNLSYGVDIFQGLANLNIRESNDTIQMKFTARADNAGVGARMIFEQDQGKYVFKKGSDISPNQWNSGVLDFSDIDTPSSQRVFKFPNKSGTIALLDDITTGGGNPEGYSNTGTLLGGDLAVFIGEDGSNADTAYINLDSPNNRVVIQSGNINLGGVLKLDDFSETPGTISSPVTGMLIIDSNDGNKLKYYNGTNWMEISATID